MKKLRQRVLAGLLTSAICIGSVNSPVFAQENENGTSMSSGMKNVSILGNEVGSYGSGLFNKALKKLSDQKVYDNGNYKVIFLVTSSWMSGYNASVKIENTGKETIHNWHLSFKCDDEIKNIWNGDISSHTANEYIVKNVTWNQDIPVGKSVEFGISCNKEFSAFPDAFFVLGESEEVQAKDYSIDYRVYSDWGKGFTGAIQITNNSNSTLEDWILEIDFDREITDIWNGVIEKHEGNHYIIRNACYNSNINPGQIASVSFIGKDGLKESEPYNYKLYSYNLGWKPGNEEPGNEE